MVKDGNSDVLMEKKKDEWKHSGVGRQLESERPACPLVRDWPSFSDGSPWTPLVRLQDQDLPTSWLMRPGGGGRMRVGKASSLGTHDRFYPSMK